ncbi:hypothetical protein AB0K60_02145 [Thermopolyspora sp. NPDC052614]|uniref:hypothetical protein n=1 Tax=Thermopolyspora sp. NPDC052614 TaxID=3155682 RepID=UPI003433B161
MTAGGRHRLGNPYETVRRRPWDLHRRAEADALNDQEPAWTVLYGPWSRAFWAFASLPVPRPLVIDARTAEELWEQMRAAEMSLALAGGRS